ncbi:hypothetical protein RSOLAG22IIIB_09284 [Rhizoctonia solani]|uniref:Uncharacterized protein n=1 Tax=Rhizoctonia solani TaxID=456999 RepID=A0A0K6FYE0_9AGAM|nr:hypothetical protein RSOLAG22IIIB_09284 [Rhizoctonia solani]
MVSFNSIALLAATIFILDVAATLGPAKREAHLAQISNTIPEKRLFGRAEDFDFQDTPDDQDLDNLPPDLADRDTDGGLESSRSALADPDMTTPDDNAPESPRVSKKEAKKSKKELEKSRRKDRKTRKKERKERKERKKAKKLKKKERKSKDKSECLDCIGRSLSDYTPGPGFDLIFDRFHVP